MTPSHVYSKEFQNTFTKRFRVSASVPTFFYQAQSCTAYFRSSMVESCEHFYIELILGRFARSLLSKSLLNDLGTFAAHLEFDLVSWLTKER